MPLLDPDSVKTMTKLGELSSLGIQLVATIGLFAVIGWYADRYFHSQPWGLLIGCLIGGGGGMYQFIRVVMKESRDSETKK